MSIQHSRLFGSWKALASSLLVTSALGAQVAALAAPAIKMDVYKTSTCGCCKEWVTYLQKEGYEMKSIDLPQEELTAKKDTWKVPQDGRSCHTGLVGKYVVEGHVPHQAIAKLLKEKPDVIGISVPNMPMNSPGMGPHTPGTLKVFLIQKNGTLKEWGLF